MELKFFLHVFIAFTFTSLLVTGILLYNINNLYAGSDSYGSKHTSGFEDGRPLDFKIWSHDPMVMQGLVGIRSRRRHGNPNKFSLTQINFNNTCLGFVWSKLHLNNIAKYTMELINLKVPDMKPISRTLAGIDVDYRQCHLNVSTPYMVTLTAFDHNLATMETAVGIMWTTHQVPSPPDLPKVTSVTRTTITLTLPDLTLTNGPLTAIEIRIKPVVAAVDEPQLKINHTSLPGTTVLQRNKRDTRQSELLRVLETLDDDDDYFKLVYKRKHTESIETIFRSHVDGNIMKLITNFYSKNFMNSRKTTDNKQGKSNQHKASNIGQQMNDVKRFLDVRNKKRHRMIRLSDLVKLNRRNERIRLSDLVKLNRRNERIRLSDLVKLNRRNERIRLSDLVKLNRRNERIRLSDLVKQNRRNERKDVSGAVRMKGTTWTQVDNSHRHDTILRFMSDSPSTHGSSNVDSPSTHGSSNVESDLIWPRSHDSNTEKEGGITPATELLGNHDVTDSSLSVFNKNGNDILWPAVDISPDMKIGYDMSSLSELSSQHYQSASPEVSSQHYQSASPEVSSQHSQPASPEVSSQHSQPASPEDNLYLLQQLIKNIENILKSSVSSDDTSLDLLHLFSTTSDIQILDKQTCQLCMDMLHMTNDMMEQAHQSFLSRVTAEITNQMVGVMKQLLDRIYILLEPKTVSQHTNQSTRRKRSLRNVGPTVVKEAEDRLKVDPYQTWQILISDTGQPLLAKTGYGYFMTDHYGLRHPYFNNSKLERCLRRLSHYQEAKDFILYGKLLLNLTNLNYLDVPILYNRLNKIMEVNRQRRYKLFINLFDDFLFWNVGTEKRQTNEHAVPSAAKLGLPPGLPVARVTASPAQNLTIGDNSMYGGIANPPLEPGKQYEVVLVVLSTVVDVTKHAWCSFNVTTLPNAPEIVAPHLQILAGLLLATGLVVIVGVYLVPCCARRRDTLAYYGVHSIV